MQRICSIRYPVCSGPSGTVQWQAVRAISAKSAIKKGIRSADNQDRKSSPRLASRGSSPGSSVSDSRSERPRDRVRSSRPSFNRSGPTRPFDRSTRDSSSADRASRDPGSYERPSRNAGSSDTPFDNSASFSRSSGKSRHSEETRPHRSGRESDRSSRDAGSINPSRGFDRSSREYRPSPTDDRNTRPSYSSEKPSRDLDRDPKTTRSRKGDYAAPPAFEDGLPASVPRTTAASVFLYGYNTVLAALRGRRRKFYTLHLADDAGSRDGGPNAKNAGAARNDQIFGLQSLAAAAKVAVKQRAHPQTLNRMSEGRPHNGFVLEASALPIAPITCLGAYDEKTSRFPVVAEWQSAEDEAINGKPVSYEVPRSARRRPFLVFLDGITDPGNVGNIIRTGHFLGVDAIVIATATCANLQSPILAKASAGACEAITLYKTSKPSSFLHQSRLNGWKIYGAMAPDSRSAKQDADKHPTSFEIAANSPLTDDPVILVLGSEGEGLPDSLIRRCDKFVSIPRPEGSDRSHDIGVDSINVTVAGGILMESFLRGATASKETSRSDNARDADATSESEKSSPKKDLSAEKPLF